jgi:hypothetical protein
MISPIYWLKTAQAWGGMEMPLFIWMVATLLLGCGMVWFGRRSRRPHFGFAASWGIIWILHAGHCIVTLVNVLSWIYFTDSHLGPVQLRQEQAALISAGFGMAIMSSCVLLIGTIVSLLNIDRELQYKHI